MFDFCLIIVTVDVHMKLDFLQLLSRRIPALRLQILLLLILKFAEIHDAHHRRSRTIRYQHQIQPGLMRQLPRSRQRNHIHLFALGTDQTHLIRSEAAIIGFQQLSNSDTLLPDVGSLLCLRTGPPPARIVVSEYNTSNDLIFNLVTHFFRKLFDGKRPELPFPAVPHRRRAVRSLAFADDEQIRNALVARILDLRPETRCTYVRLDREIGNLIDMVDKRVGLRNALFFITSTGYNDPEKMDLAAYRIPTGDFYMDRCTALLNMYLMATYGQGKYVQAYNGLNIYFDHKLIEQKQLSLPEVLNKSAEFLVQVSGVKAAYTAHQLALNANTPERLLLRNAFNIDASGDILLELAPGWKHVSEDPLVDSHYTSASLINFPIIFFGHSVKPEIIPVPATVDCIAPTVTHFVRIRAPNACRSTLLGGIR